MFTYPHHRIPNPTCDDYANVKCTNCESFEVIWADEKAGEVECYECGTIAFIER